MDLDAIMEEVGTVFSQLTGVEVLAYPPDTISGPSGYVSYPASIDFDETYGRGSDQITDLPIVLLVPRPNSRGARAAVARWSRGDDQGLKALAEKHVWASCDDLTINACSFDIESVGGTDYLAAIFTATVVGPGAGED